MFGERKEYFNEIRARFKSKQFGIQWNKIKITSVILPPTHTPPHTHTHAHTHTPFQLMFYVKLYQNGVYGISRASNWKMYWVPLWIDPLTWGTRCSSVQRAFAHGAMDRRIDPSWWTHWDISCYSQCSTTVTKAVVCVICGGDVYKRTLAVNRKE